MTPRRLLVIGALLIAAAGGWAVIRATHGAEASSPESTAENGAPLTLRFFRDAVPAPSFTLQDLDGRTISSSDLRGKVTLINFWATWCPPCRAEIPDLIALQHKYPTQLRIIGVSEDEIPAEQVKKFVVANQMTYTIAMTTPEFERLFPGINALPTSYLVDREGRIVMRHAGMLNAALTEAETRSLAGLPVDAKIEQVDRVQKAQLENGAQATTIPGVDLTSLTPGERATALQRLNSEACTCGCELSLAKCRIDDPGCGVSLPLAKTLVDQIAKR